MKSLLLIILMLFANHAPAADDLVGTWRMTSESPRGTRESELVVRQVGDGLAGTFKGRRTMEIAEIKRSGDDFSFDIEIDTQMGSFKLTYNGTISGNTISGKVETPRGGSSFKGVRE